jgi:hypothetical protein
MTSKYLQMIFSSLAHVYPVEVGTVSCFRNLIFSLDAKLPDNISSAYVGKLTHCFHRLT